MANKYGELHETDSSVEDGEVLIHPLKLGVNIISNDLNAHIRLYSIGSKCFVEVNEKKMVTVSSKSNINLVEVNGKCLRKGESVLLLPNSTITFGNTKLTYFNSNLTEQEIAQFQRIVPKPKIFTTPRHRASSCFGANIFRPSKRRQFNWQADVYDIMPRPSPSHKSVDSDHVDSSLQTSENKPIVDCTKITESKNTEDTVCIIEEKFDVNSIYDNDTVVISPRITKSLEKMMNIASRFKSSEKRTTTTLEKEFPPLLLHENEGTHSERIIEVEEDVLPYCETDVNKSQHTEELEPDSSTNRDSESYVLVKAQHSSTPQVAIKPLLENSSSQPSSTNKNLDRSMYTDAITNTPSVVSHSFYSISPDRLLCMENDDLSGITLLNSPTKSQESDDTEYVQDPQCNSSQSDVEEEEFWEPVVCMDDDSQSADSDMTEYEIPIATEEEPAMPCVDLTTDIDFPYSPYNKLSDTFYSDDCSSKSSLNEASLQEESTSQDQCEETQNLDSSNSDDQLTALQCEKNLSLRGFPSPASSVYTTPCVKKTYRNTPVNTPSRHSSTNLESEWEITEITHPITPSTSIQATNVSLLNSSRNVPNIAIIQPTVQSTMKKSLNTVGTGQNSPNCKNQVSGMQEADNAETFHQTDHDSVMKTPSPKQNLSGVAKLQTSLLQEGCNSLNKLSSNFEDECCVKTPNHSTDLSLTVQEQVNIPKQCSIPTQSERKPQIDDLSTVSSTSAEVVMSEPGHSVKDEFVTKTPDKQNLLKFPHSLKKLQGSGHLTDSVDVGEAVNSFETNCSIRTPLSNDKRLSLRKLTCFVDKPLSSDPSMESSDIEEEVFEPLKESVDTKKPVIGDLPTDYGFQEGFFDSSPNRGVAATRTPAKQDILNKVNISRLSGSTNKLKTLGSSIDCDDSDETSKPLQESFVKLEDECNTKTPPTKSKVQGVKKITRSVKKLSIGDLSDCLSEPDPPARRTSAEQNSIDHNDGEEVFKPLKESIDKYEDECNTKTLSSNRKMQSAGKKLPIIELSTESSDNEGVSDCLPESDVPATRTPAKQNTLSIENISRLSLSLKKLQSHDGLINLKDGEEIAKPLQESVDDLEEKNNTNNPSPNHKVQSARKVTRSAKKLLFGELSTESIDNDGDSDSLQEKNLPTMKTPAKQNTPNMSKLSRSVKKLQTRSSSIDVNDGEEITKPLQELFVQLGGTNDTNTPSPNHKVQSARKVTRSAKKPPIGRLSTESSDDGGVSDSFQEPNLPATRTPAKQNTPNISKLSQSVKKLQTRRSSIDLHDGDEITKPLQGSVDELRDQNDTNTPSPNHKVHSSRKVTRSAKKLLFGELPTESIDNDGDSDSLQEENLLAKQNTPNISRLSRSVKKLQTCDSSIDLHDGEEITKPFQELFVQLGDKNDANTPSPNHKVQSAQKVTNSAKKLLFGELSTESIDNDGDSDSLQEEKNLPAMRTPAKQNTPNISKLSCSVKKLQTRNSSIDLNEGEEITIPLQEIFVQLREKNDTHTPSPNHKVQSARKMTRSAKKLPIGELSTDNEGDSDSFQQENLLAMRTPAKQNTPNISRMSRSVKKLQTCKSSIDLNDGDEITKPSQEIFVQLGEKNDTHTPSPNHKVQIARKMTRSAKKLPIGELSTESSDKEVDCDSLQRENLPLQEIFVQLGEKNDTYTPSPNHKVQSARKMTRSGIKLPIVELSTESSDTEGDSDSLQRENLPLQEIFVQLGEKNDTHTPSPNHKVQSARKMTRSAKKLPIDELSTESNDKEVDSDSLQREKLLAMRTPAKQNTPNISRMSRSVKKLQTFNSSIDLNDGDEITKPSQEIFVQLGEKNDTHTPSPNHKVQNARKMTRSAKTLPIVELSTESSDTEGDSDSLQRENLPVQEIFVQLGEKNDTHAPSPNHKVQSARKMTRSAKKLPIGELSTESSDKEVDCDSLQQENLLAMRTPAKQNTPNISRISRSVKKLKTRNSSIDLNDGEEITKPLQDSVCELGDKNNINTPPPNHKVQSAKKFTHSAKKLPFAELSTESSNNQGISNSLPESILSSVNKTVLQQISEYDSCTPGDKELNQIQKDLSKNSLLTTPVTNLKVPSARLTRSMRKKLMFGDSTSKKNCPDGSGNDLSHELVAKTPSMKITHIGLLSGKDEDNHSNKVVDSSPTLAEFTKSQNSSSNQGDPQESIKQKLIFDDEESSGSPDPNKCEKSAVETAYINEAPNLNLREHSNLSDSVDHKDTYVLLSKPKSVLQTPLASKNLVVGKHLTRSAKKKLIIDNNDNTTPQGVDEFVMATPSTSRNLPEIFVETIQDQLVETSMNTSTFQPIPVEHTLEAAKRKRSPEIVISNESGVKRTRTLEVSTSKAENSTMNDHTDVKMDLETPMAQKEPINDLRDVRGVRNLFETKQLRSPNNDLTDIKGVKKMYATPKVQRSPTNDLSDIRGVKKILKTPKPQKEPKNELENVGGVRNLFESKETKSPYNNLTDVKGVKRMYATPINRQAPKNDLSDIRGVRKIFKTPKPESDLRDVRGIPNLFETKEISSPINDLTNIKGVKKLYASPRTRRSPKDDLTDVKGLKKLFKIQKPQKEPKNDLEDMRGLRNLFEPKERGSPINDLTDVRGVKQLYTSPKLHHSPKNELSDIRGVRKMFQTPKIRHEPKNDLSDVRGIRNLLRTPKPQTNSDDLEDISDLASLFEDEFDRLIEKKAVRQYPGKTSPMKSPLTRERKAIFDLSKSTDSHVEKWIKEQNQELQENNKNLSQILSEIQNKSAVNVSYNTSTPIDKSSKENFVPQLLSSDGEESYGRSKRIKHIPTKFTDGFILRNLSVKLRNADHSIEVRNTTDLENEKTPLAYDGKYKMSQRKKSPENDTEENKVHVRRPVRGRGAVKARGEEKHDAMSSSYVNSSTQSHKEVNKRGESKSKTDESGNNTDEIFVVPTPNLGRKRKLAKRYEEANVEELVQPKTRRARHGKQLDRDINTTEPERNDNEKEEINETVELLQTRVTRSRRPKQLNEGIDTTDTDLHVTFTSTRTQKNLKPEKDDIEKIELSQSRSTRSRRAKQVGQDANITDNDTLTKSIPTRKPKNVEHEELKEKSAEEPLQLRTRKGSRLKQLDQEADTTDDVKPTAPLKREPPEPEKVQLQTRATRSRGVKQVNLKIDLSLNDSHTSTKQADVKSQREKAKEDTKKSPDKKPEPRQLRPRRVRGAEQTNNKIDISHNDSHTSTKQTDRKSVPGADEEDGEKSMDKKAEPIKARLRRARGVKQINNETDVSHSDSHSKPTSSRRQKDSEPPSGSDTELIVNENWVAPETKTEVKTTVRTRRKAKTNDTSSMESSNNDITTSEFLKNITDPKTTRKRERHQTDTDENELSDKNGNLKPKKVRKTAKDVVNEAMVAISTRSNRRAVKTMINTLEINNTKGSDQPVTRSRRKILS